jgi:hypothetical protein
LSVTCFAVATDATAAMNAALVALAGIETSAGTVTAELLLNRLMLCPLLGAGEASVTTQESVPDPVMDALTQENPLNVGVVPWHRPLKAKLNPQSNVTDRIVRQR